MRSVGALQDPFEDCDSDGSNAYWVEWLNTKGAERKQLDLISGEDNILVCRKLENNNWDEAFFLELGTASKKLPTDEGDDSVEMCSE